MLQDDLFSHDRVRTDLLRDRAYNDRWATQPGDVIPLTAADPDFPVAVEIRAAMKAYVDGGVLSYGPPEGLPEFKETVARVMRERKNLPCSTDLILPTDGAASAMFLIARTYCGPGDEVIIFDPVDFLFGQSVDAAGAARVYSPVDKTTGEFDLEGLWDLVTPRTRMICVCNPHNPLGRVMTREELLTIGQLAVEHDLMIMSDEIWSDIVYPPAEHISLGSIDPDIAERTISVYGFSKTFGLAGLRIGFLVAPTPVVYEQLVEMSGMRTTAAGATTVSQVGAKAAYDAGWCWAEAFLDHLEKVRDYAVGRLNAMPGVRCPTPEGTYVLFPDITQLDMSSKEVADFILREARVAVVPGLPRWFGPGAEGHIRLCYSTSLQLIREALDRIELALRSLA